MKRILALFLCIAFLLPGTARSSPDGFLSDPDAIEKAISSVLFIAAFDNSGDGVVTGSGFVAFDSRTVVTNYHVIESAVEIWATDENENVYRIARVLAKDEDNDLAILSIEGQAFLRPLKLAGGTRLKRGEPVLAIGSPEGLFNSVSEGIISRIYDPKVTLDIQFTAPISHGSSGGALFNDAGEVIGVTSATAEQGQNLNFAIGIHHAIDLYREVDSSYWIPSKLEVLHHVYDDAGTFSADDIRYLETAMQTLYEEIGVDSVIVTTNTSFGKPTDQYAADFYEVVRDHKKWDNYVSFALAFDVGVRGAYGEAAHGWPMNLLTARGDDDLYNVLAPFLPSCDYGSAMREYISYLGVILTH